MLLVYSSANIDAMSKKADNVLFSVSDSEGELIKNYYPAFYEHAPETNFFLLITSLVAGWHTDGASKDRVYDVVSLLCISPAAKGGEFRVSNACKCCPFSRFVSVASLQ